MKQIGKFKIVAGRLMTRIVSGWLHARISVLRRRLSLHFISTPDTFIFSGNDLDMRWQVTGCYKIMINDSILLPGNTRGVLLNSADLPGILKIRFFGREEMLSRTYNLHKLNVTLGRALAPVMFFGKYRPAHISQESLCLIGGKLLFRPRTLPGMFNPPDLPLKPALNRKLCFPALHLELSPYPFQLNQYDYETRLL